MLLARLSRSGEVIVAPEKANYLKDYLECRTAAKGGRVLRCDECGTHVVAYNACNRRGCPVCSRKNQVNWQIKARERLLNVGHHHLVFSFPESVTQRWIKQPRAVVHELLQGVRKVIGKLEKQKSLTLGSILVFQSHCRGLAYKAHVHCVMTAGGLDNEDHWQPLGVLPLEQMTRWLQKAVVSGEGDNGWRIHESRHRSGGESVVQYLGQRLNGTVVFAKDIQEGSGGVVVRTREGESRMEIATFGLRYLNHVPSKGTVLVRNCGLYSNRQKERHQKAKAQLGEGEHRSPEDSHERCPRCKGQLRTIMSTVMKPLEFDHRRLGFGVDPPVHWEISKAS